MEAFGRRGALADQVGNKRPAAGRARLRESWKPRPMRRPPGRGAEEAQRRERVVRHLARPHKVPESIEDRLLVASAGRVVEDAEEARATGLEVLAQSLMELVAGGVIGWRDRAGRVPAEVERVVSRGCARGASSDPHNLPHGDENAKNPGGVTADASGYDVALDHTRRQGRA